jgi:hypothetical protein
MNSDLEYAANTGQVSLRDAVAQYHNYITDALDQHAPDKQRTVLLRPNVPWFSEMIVTERQEERRLERQYRRSKLTVHKEVCIQQAKTVDRVIEQAKREHYSSQISALNPSDAIGFINGLMGHNKHTPLPSHDTDIELAMRFIDKVAGIRDRLPAVNQTQGPCSEVYEVSSALNTFEVIEPAELSKLIMAMKSKSCALDPAPTLLVKKCLGAILSLISYITVSSLASGVFQMSGKRP